MIKKVNSISLMLMGIGLLPLAYFIEDVYLQSFVLVASIVLNIMAIIRSFKEKNEKKL